MKEPRRFSTEPRPGKNCCKHLGKEELRAYRRPIPPAASSPEFFCSPTPNIWRRGAIHKANRRAGLARFAMRGR